uniref:23S rRNA (Uracil(1939)-C(5))-methyltransferase RlmD n=1 Tax=Acidobacterium capsulatum TaxID=33075 RepID=A0A7V4XRW8_9BACT
MKVRIEKAIYGGAGLARHEGKAIFVERSLPGELVEAKIVTDKASYSEARLIEVLEPSAERVAAPCPYYGACGGCQYQHASEDEQLRMKAAILQETLERARLKDLPEMQMIAGEPWGYRNRIRLHVETKPFRLGYRREHSHVTLPVEECRIAAPVLVRAMQMLVEQCEAALAGWAREVELFTDDATERLWISVYADAATTKMQGRLDALWERLQGALPEASGCAAFALPTGKGFARRVATAGDPWLTYAAGGLEYRVSAGAFFQVNRFLVDRMAAAVCEARAGATAWDLYAGVGLFAKALMPRFEHVTAVEAAPESVADLRVNAPGARVVAATTLDFLRKAAQEAGKRKAAPELVVVDPPRAGLGKDVTGLLGKIRPRHITYVSCDPATLSRDLFALLQSGYRFRSLHLLDMFPQTFHVETIAQLTLE